MYTNGLKAGSCCDLERCIKSINLKKYVVIWECDYYNSSAPFEFFLLFSGEILFEVLNSIEREKFLDEEHFYIWPLSSVLYARSFVLSHP